MSKKPSAATAAKTEIISLEKMRFEFTSIPGVKDPNVINACVRQVNMPGGERGKSNTMIYDSVTVLMVETVDLNFVKFASWLQTASGDLAYAKLFVQNKAGKDVMCAEIEGMEIVQVGGVTLGAGATIGTFDEMEYQVTFRVGRVKYTVL